ncbi:hypothetical protein FRAAL4698 [Frankia alni ACN14a]|uniref:Uncharacterized protein n=1 Tax=Frankia alni (strain DSM 45986 / CECT 9034 / ACN14a) TaxID=326424 RepID=Q0RGP6_FRAAA|nr:hypothetical protein FRAAL4698 [Frankia alni ACN14a]
MVQGPGNSGLKAGISRSADMRGMPRAKTFHVAWPDFLLEEEIIIFATGSPQQVTEDLLGDAAV